MKLKLQDQWAIGYFAKKITDKSMKPSREYPGLKKEFVKSESCWATFNGWLEGLGLKPVEDGDYDEAAARIKVILASAK